MSSWFKDAGENIYEWWKKEKISGTIMPIFLILNVLKFEKSGTDFTVAELIANGFMLVIMIYAIRSFYIRSALEGQLERDMEVKLKKITDDTKVELAKVKVEADHILQEKLVQDFAMNIVKREKEYQYNLIVEQADFITEQVTQKTDHIVFLTEYFDAKDSNTKQLIETHKSEISDLRVYQKKLPHKIEMKFDDFIAGVDEIPKTHSAPAVMKEELDNILDKVKHNMEVEETVDEIKGNQT